MSALESRSYEIPTDQPEADGTLRWNKTTVVVARASAAGVVGTGWTYGSKACQSVIDGELSESVVGTGALNVPEAHARMVNSCRNLGRPGVASCAVSAVDIALWDLKARLLGVSVSALFGQCIPAVPIYGSGGFTTYDSRATASQLEGWVAGVGVGAVKIKIGENWGRQVDRDMRRVSLAREVVGNSVELFVDANGGYRRKQAVRVGRQLAGDHDVVWFEEPVSSDDLAGLRQVRDQVAVDVAAGEYGFDEPYFARMVEAEAVDCLQIDATRCGGYTSWLRAAAIAGAHNLDVSAHCGPNLHAQVAGSVPNLRHVEYFHDHVRADPMLFDGLPVAVDGTLRPDPDSAGHGMTLRHTDADRFRVG